MPNPFKSLEAAGTNLTRGQLALIAAPAGIGKSAFALTWALKADVPTMYFSADSDAFVQLTRSISIKSGIDLNTVSEWVLENDIDSFGEYVNSPHIRFSYSASPSLDDIERNMLAYNEVYGDYPHLVVVDNVTNVRADSSDADDPFSGLESLMDYFADMGRQTEACVVGLHHVTGPYNDADKPIPLSGVKGQISRVPSMILTLHKQPGEYGEPDLLCVSTVKNRGGKADPSGNQYVELVFEGDRMSIRDLQLVGN